MASELQRIAQALLATLDQVPQVVAHLQRAATWCRQQIAVIHHTFGATHRDGQDLVLLLDHAARRCDEAAHALALAPPTARARAQNLTDTPPPAPRPLTDTPPPTPSRTRPPAAGPDPHPPTTGTDPPAEQTVVDLSTTDPAHHHTLRNPPPNSVLRVDGRFTYRTDHLGRVTHATTTLTTINLTPMHANINQSTYRRLENKWAKAIKNGQDVQVTVELEYIDGTSRRPERLDVEYVLGGETYFKTIRNPGKKLQNDGKR